MFYMYTVKNVKAIVWPVIIETCVWQTSEKKNKTSKQTKKKKCTLLFGEIQISLLLKNTSV